MEQTDMIAVQPTRVSIKVREDITLDALQEIIGRLGKQIGELNGCTTCGLNGFDLDIGSIRTNPAIDKLREVSREFERDMSQIVDVTVFEGPAGLR